MPVLAVQPMQHPAYVAGKNATDSALIIDAMDLLHSGNVDTFFLVASDSDFTRLAMRRRESGRRVFGIGAQKTPGSFQNACDRFTFTEVLVQPVEAPASEGAQDFALAAETTADDVLDPTAVPPLDAALVPAIRAMERDDGWAPLSAVGTYIVNNHGRQQRRTRAPVRARRADDDPAAPGPAGRPLIMQKRTLLDADSYGHVERSGDGSAEEHQPRQPRRDVAAMHRRSKQLAGQQSATEGGGYGTSAGSCRTRPGCAANRRSMGGAAAARHSSRDHRARPRRAAGP